jgi:hypothetical protein
MCIRVREQKGNDRPDDPFINFSDVDDVEVDEEWEEPDLS